MRKEGKGRTDPSLAPGPWRIPSTGTEGSAVWAGVEEDPKSDLRKVRCWMGAARGARATRGAARAVLRRVREAMLGG